MKHSEQPCRVCGANEFYLSEVEAQGHGGPNLLPVGGFFSQAPRLIIRVCGSCGLVEWFVPPRLLAKVKAKFERDSG